MEHCVKLGKLIKDDCFHQFSTHLAHSLPKLNPNNLSSLLFDIIKSRVDAPSKYIDLILKNKVDIDHFYRNMARNPQFFGKTPLMAACEISKFQVINSLLQYKNIKVEIKDSEGRNCMFYALNHGSEEQCYRIIGALTSFSQNLVNSTNLQGKSIIIQALEKKSLRVVELLLKNSADPNFKCKKTGNTALHTALLNSSHPQKKKDIILLLLNNRADLTIQNKNHKNCFDIAKQVNFQFDWLVNLYKENEQSNQQAITCYQQINSVTKQDENSINQNLSSQVQSDEDQQQFSIEKLNQQMQALTKNCEKKHEQSWKDIQVIYYQLKLIGEYLHLTTDIIGSYANGLWTPLSDIDIVYTNNDSNYINIQNTLDKIYNMICKKKQSLGIREIYINLNTNTNIFPNIKLDLDHKLNNRKIDITIFQKKNNGQKYVKYITEQLRYLPLIKPVFFTLQKLLYRFKLENPAKNGLKTYAIFLMILLSASRVPYNNGAQLFINTIYFYAHCFTYQLQEDRTYKLSICDPLNEFNNVGGRKTDVDRLIRMFRTVDYGLRHSSGKNILEGLFNLNNIFLE